MELFGKRNETITDIRFLGISESGAPKNLSLEELGQNVSFSKGMEHFRFCGTREKYAGGQAQQHAPFANGCAPEGRSSV